MTQAPVDVEPGAWIQMEEEDLALRQYIADLNNTIEELRVAIAQEANDIERERLKWQMQKAKDDLAFRREELAEKRQVTELGLATSPIDFVAYEMYKRYLQESGSEQQAKYDLAETQHQGGLQQQERNYQDKLGKLEAQLVKYSQPPYYKAGRPPTEMMEIYTDLIKRHKEQYAATVAEREPWVNPEEEGWAPVAAPRSDEDIQQMVNALAGEGGGSLGTGEFGVSVPMTQAFSRQEGAGLSQDEMAVLSSFLHAGFDVNGEQVSYDPADYWQEVEEGWIPTMGEIGPTQYSY